MGNCSVLPGAVVEQGAAICAREPEPKPLKAALLTGGFDKPYASGLTLALAARNVHLDIIGSDAVDGPAMHSAPHLNFLNLRGSKEEAGLAAKVRRVLHYYMRLLGYVSAAEPKIFHILWNDKLEYFDRTILALYYRMLGKKVVRTAHNVNAGRRDGNDSWLNRLTLRAQYRLAHHIFVHSVKMKQELIGDFGLAERRVTVVPFGINNDVPHTALSTGEAKRKLGLGNGEKTILFFGAIRPYKGLEHLVEAFRQLAEKHPEYRLLIAGSTRKGSEEYWERLERTIAAQIPPGRVIRKIEFIPDQDTELYFKAADVLALPYTQVSQSGVLFLAYSFGLPVVATDVGSLQDDIVEGRNGFLCRPNDPGDLAGAFEQYFQSGLFQNLDSRREEIREQATRRHSWETVGAVTRKVYDALIARLS